MSNQKFFCQNCPKSPRMQYINEYTYWCGRCGTIADGTTQENADFQRPAWMDKYLPNELNDILDNL